MRNSPDLQALGEGDLARQLMKFGRGAFAVLQHDLAKRSQASRPAGRTT